VSWQPPIIPWTPDAHCVRNILWTPKARTQYTLGNLDYSAFSGCVLGTHKLSRGPLMLAALATQSKVNSIIQHFTGCVLATYNILWTPDAHCVRNYLYTLNSIRRSTDLTRGFACLDTPQIIPWSPIAHCVRNTIQGQLYYSAFHGCVLATTNYPVDPDAHCVRNTIQGQLYYSTFHGVCFGNLQLSRGPLMLTAFAISRGPP